MKSNLALKQRVVVRRKLKNPSDEALLAVVVLGLIAAASDGKPENIEIQSLRDNLSKFYLQESKDILAFMQLALKCINNCDPDRLARSSCDILKEQLTQSQLFEIFDIISDIILADGNIDCSEEEYIKQIAKKFELENVLRSIRPSLNFQR